MSFSSRKQINLLHNFVSRTLDIAGSALIGLSLFRAVLSPDLKIGNIFAVFRLPGTIPVLNDWFI